MIFHSSHAGRSRPGRPFTSMQHEGGSRTMSTIGRLRRYSVCSAVHCVASVLGLEVPLVSALAAGTECGNEAGMV